MLAWRGLFGALGIAAIALVIEGRDACGNLLRLGWVGWLYAVLSAGGMVLFIASLRHTTVAHVAVIYAIVPFFAAALGWMVLRDVPSRSAVVASIAALGGVIIMVGLGREGGLLGDTLALGMTAAMAGMMVLARCFGNVPVLAAAALSALLSGLVCWPMAHPLAVNGADLFILLKSKSGRRVVARSGHPQRPPRVENRSCCSRKRTFEGMPRSHVAISDPGGEQTGCFGAKRGERRHCRVGEHRPLV